MSRDNWSKYVELLKHEVVPAIGCTEPVAVALAAATARKYLSGSVAELEVFVSANLMKNGMGVQVPGTGMVGLEIAAAVGALGGDSEAELKVLHGITKETLLQGKRLIAEDRVVVKVKNVPNILYVEVNIKDDNGDVVTVLIEDEHTNIVKIVKNADILFENKKSVKKDATSGTSFEELKHLAQETTIKDIWEFGVGAPLEMIDFIYDAATMNSLVAKEGLEHEYGLRIGRTFQKSIDRGILADDLLSEVMEKSSAASDARMGGCELPVMTNSGSGNQGIAATMPVVVVASRLEASKEMLIRALIISHLSAIHIKSNLGVLSAMCAATVAAMGSACGMVFLAGGTRLQAEYAIENMIGDVTGIICDGAKSSCSMKVATSVASAVKSSLLALDDIRVSENEGINDKDIEDVIKNLGIVGRVGMHDTDKTILDIMTHKHH